MTQAMNLANFSNTLDSSGGVPPSALNAPVTLAKGGTNAATASAARTNLGVDYSTLLVQVGTLLFPVGSIYSSTVSTNPGTSLGFGTWTAFGAGRVMIGNGGGFTAGATGGSADAVVVSHTHTFTGDALPTHAHTYTMPASGTVVNNINGTNAGALIGTTSAVSAGTPTGTNSTTGVSATNANLQPYIVVYMWQRTA